MKKLIPFSLVLIIACCVVSCTTQGRLANTRDRNGIVNIRQPRKSEKQADTTKKAAKVYHSFKDKDGNNQIIAESAIDETTGENIAVFSLGEVEVVAKSKTVPERNGKITLPFVVNVPKQYAQSDWRITIHPKLDNGGKLQDLQPIAIAGMEYREYNKRRNAFKADRMEKDIKVEQKLASRRKSLYPYKYRNDSSVVHKQEKFETWKTGLEEEGKWRLDTIIDKNNTLTYYYKQEFQTEDMRRKLKLSFTAVVEDLGQVYHYLPEGDTLNYFLSSMTQFMDRSTRYIRETVLRKVTDKVSAYIHFPLGSTEVVPDLFNNTDEIAKVSRKMKEIIKGNEFVVDSIELISSCSPEGNYSTNVALARGRAISLQKYLRPILNNDAVEEDLVKLRPMGENWEGLTLAIKESDLPNKAGVLNIIETVKDPDQREIKIARDYPAAYATFKETLYPKLRAVDFIFHLARRGMVEDIMYTDVVDTAYAKAIELMDDRRYKEAMPKLLEYNDMNCAICLMSLGYNGRAVNILIELPQSPDRDYLLAILYARLNEDELAKQLYLKCCEEDPSKVERGELDPEIAALIQKYNLTKELYKY